MNKNKTTVRKVVKGLKKASATHAKQAKTLQSLKLKKGGSTSKKKSTVNKAGKAQMLAKAYKKAGGGYK